MLAWHCCVNLCAEALLCCCCCRVEVTRNGLFEKYVFLPNDAIPLYGMRTWLHRDAIPQELLKMVRAGMHPGLPVSYTLPFCSAC
jgi:hypothetical protein